MKFYIGITDNSWFEFLSNLAPDEVNFWQPGGKSSFQAIQPGEPFLFKLHSPDNYIVGGGFFVRKSLLPLSLSWDTFGEKNGTDNFDDFRTRIIDYRRAREGYEADPTIGCIILTQPFFFERSEWIPVPQNWSPNIVQGKTYTTDDSIGAELWSNVLSRLARIPTVENVSEERPLYGAEYLAHARLGQGGFRILVTDAYQSRCSITKERTLPALEAAHIKPYARSGPHKIGNGLLLRSDLHKLLDSGYMTVTRDYKVEVSKHIREEFENGRDYYALHGRELSLPSNSLYVPSQEYIDWHNQEIYKS